MCDEERVADVLTWTEKVNVAQAWATDIEALRVEGMQATVEAARRRTRPEQDPELN